MAERHCWVRLPLIDGLHAHVRADQVVSVGNMLLRSSETVDGVWNRIVEATA